ncbi:acyl-homoserine-lactone synthase [Biostraticola tofi]|uniref:Acyl-homoserine-lactone synthase n=1 Tax=Biostraticola tofi TaxID=466109 RepID=A0A4R3Z1M2_9GAMM|nr:acyl-homoserine-lactone synthase [Biostraticola tofi]TCV98895.1 acyl homoserine lactone synthase [Biostraticola tofi]
MFNLINVGYEDIVNDELEELYLLRKKTFKDRLDWRVSCIGDREFDQYDNKNTHYLLGCYEGDLICSVRFINMNHPNMITGPFNEFFDYSAPEDHRLMESSRFFVDKQRVKSLTDTKLPFCHLLFLGMVNYARSIGKKGILTVCSKSMYIILKRSGWIIKIESIGMSEKNEPVYLLNLGIDDKSQENLMKYIKRHHYCEDDYLKKWPLHL